MAARNRLTRASPVGERAPVILTILADTYPDAKVALRFSNPLECVVATILSAQCTDERVNQVTEHLFRKYKTPTDYLEVPEEELAADIKPTGFFNQKTRSIRGMARVLVEEFDGQVPQTMEELIRLPGVARKTANIVQVNMFPDRAESDPDAGVAVDTHVRRVSQRLGFTEQTDPDKIERDLMALVPRGDWKRVTYLLIEHGRAICVARRPRCETCPVSDLCPSSLV